MTIGADAPLWDEQERREQFERDVAGLDEVQAWAWEFCEDVPGARYEGLVAIGRWLKAQEVRRTVGRVVARRERPPLVFDATEAEIAEAVEDSRYLHRGPWTQQAPSGELAGREVE